MFRQQCAAGAVTASMRHVSRLSPGTDGALNQKEHSLTSYLNKVSQDKTPFVRLEEDAPRLINNNVFVSFHQLP